MNIFAISALAVVFFFQLAARGQLRSAVKYAFFISLAVVFCFAAYSSVAQYYDWKEGAVTQFFLPPHQGIGYFLTDVGKKIIASPLIALLAAIILPRLAESLNRKYEERFFYEEEFPLMRLGLFLAGYPGFLFYIALVLSAGVSLSYVYMLLGKGRAPMRWFWMPGAIAIVLLLDKFVPHEALSRFNF